MAAGVGPEQLRRLRDRAGWTQARAAERAGVTENTWARWERGEMAVHPARVALLERLAREAERRAARRAGRRTEGTPADSV